MLAQNWLAEHQAGRSQRWLRCRAALQCAPPFAHSFVRSFIHLPVHSLNWRCELELFLSFHHHHSGSDSGSSAGRRGPVDRSWYASRHQKAAVAARKRRRLPSSSRRKCRRLQIERKRADQTRGAIWPQAQGPLSLTPALIQTNPKTKPRKRTRPEPEAAGWRGAAGLQFNSVGREARNAWLAAREEQEAAVARPSRLPGGHNCICSSWTAAGQSGAGSSGNQLNFSLFTPLANWHSILAVMSRPASQAASQSAARAASK